jgi:hypothetical protein
LIETGARQAKWLQRPDFGIRRQVLQAIASNPEAVAGYERWREQMDELWGKFFEAPTIN